MGFLSLCCESADVLTRAPKGAPRTLCIRWTVQNMPPDSKSSTSTWTELSKNTYLDAKQQLNAIEAQIRDRFYAEYCSQCSDIAPYLQQRGRSVGKQLLNALVVPYNPPDKVNYESGDEDATSTKEHLAGVDPFLGPVLDPFVAGLTEPFEEKYKDIRGAAILTLIASSAFCGLVGFALGHYLGGSSEKRK